MANAGKPTAREEPVRARNLRRRINLVLYKEPQLHEVDQTKNGLKGTLLLEIRRLLRPAC